MGWSWDPKYQDDELGFEDQMVVAAADRGLQAVEGA
jgi:hypothetical protein